MPDSPSEHRKLAAIMFTDMVGYSALAQRNEALALELLEEHRRLLRPIFPRHNGREVETAGDSFLVEFVSALEAVRCAVEIQEMLSERNRTTPPEQAIRIRIGIHVGDVVHKDGKVMGDAVNIAARNEPLATPGGICISNAVYEQVRNKVELPLVKLAQSELKNIQAPMAVYRLVVDASKWRAPPRQVSSRGRIARATAALGVIVLLSALGWRFLPKRWTSRQAANASITNAIPQVAKPGLIRSLAILPLRIISGDTNQAWLADGMTETLTTELGDLSALRVYPRASMLRFRGTTRTIKELAAELQVDALITGAVMTDSQRMRVEVQLVTSAEDELWRDSFDRDLADFFKVQSDLARSIAQSVRVQLTQKDQARLARARPVNPQALEAYLQGREQWNRRTPETLRKAMALFLKSVDLDPAFALGHAGLADAYCIAPDHIDIPANESYEKARASALKAISLDDQLAEPHVSLGFVLVKADWKWREAEAEFLRAIALKPNYPPAHYWFAYQLLVKQGRTNEALVHAEIALKLDPVTPITRGHYAMVLIAAGRNEEAIAQVRIILELEPDYPMVNWTLLLAHLRLGDYPAAVAAGKQFRAKINRPWVWGKLGYAYAAAGQKEQAQKLLDELRSQPTISPVEIAEIQAGLGMKQEALGNLELAFTQRSQGLDWLKFLPSFDSLRAEPRFQALLKNVGLEP